MMKSEPLERRGSNPFLICSCPQNFATPFNIYELIQIRCGRMSRESTWHRKDCSSESSFEVTTSDSPDLLVKGVPSQGKIKIILYQLKPRVYTKNVTIVQSRSCKRSETKSLLFWLAGEVSWLAVVVLSPCRK